MINVHDSPYGIQMCHTCNNHKIMFQCSTHTKYSAAAHLILRFLPVKGRVQLWKSLLKRFLLQVIYYVYYYTVFHITNKSNNPQTIHIMEEHNIETIKGYYGLEY